MVWMKLLLSEDFMKFWWNEVFEELVYSENGEEIFLCDGIVS